MNLRGKLLSSLAVGVGVLILLGNSTFTVPYGEADVVTYFGKPEYVALPGKFHWKLPFANSVVGYDLKTQVVNRTTDDAPVVVMTQNGYSINAFYLLTWRENVNNIMTKIQTIQDTPNKLDSISRAVLKTEISHYSPDAVIPNWQTIEQNTKAEIIKQTKYLLIDIVDFKLTNLAPDETYKKIIATRELGSTQATVLSLMAQAAHSDPSLMIANKFDGKFPSTLVTNGSSVIPLLETK